MTLTRKFALGMRLSFVFLTFLLLLTLFSGSIMHKCNYIYITHFSLKLQNERKKKKKNLTIL